MYLRQHGKSPAAWEDGLARLVLRLGNVAYDESGRVQTSGTLRIIQMAERLAMVGHKKRLLKAGSILQYEIARWSGPNLPLPNQLPVCAGEQVLILHLDNESIPRLLDSLGHTRIITWQGLKLLADDLSELAALARLGAFPDNIRAVWAETLLYPVLARFGFSSRPTPRSLRAVFVRIYLLGLVATYGRGRRTEPSRGHQSRARLGQAWIALSDLDSACQLSR